MTRSDKLLAGAAFTALLGVALPAQAATIIQDGNFDNPPVLVPFQTQFGGATFGGPTGNSWLVLGNSIDEVGTYWVNPIVGGGSVDLNGEAAGGISQNFTVAAGTYQLSFYLSGNPDGGLGTRTVEVKVGDQDLTIPYTVTAANSKSDMNYMFETVTFNSTGGGDVLSFLGQGDSAFGAVVGGISVSPSTVPEPASWIMLILGFGMMGGLLRTGRKATLCA